MERGHYGVEATNGQHELAEGVVERLTPLALSKLVIDNDFLTDLEPELWEGDENTKEIQEAGVRMGDLDLLPAPFPIEELLNEQDLRHVKRLYGIGGLSYGNLSQRLDETRFWMSASGVDKTKLDIPGRDILLVSGYAPERHTMIMSVPPNVEPRRVSVDAIEHWMIYQEHPDVGAILHVHAWMQDIVATDINYPCGTAELATSRRRAARTRAGSGARRHRPAKPRHHRDRREPDGDPGSHRAEGAAADSDVVAGPRASDFRNLRPRFGAPQPTTRIRVNAHTPRPMDSPRSVACRAEAVRDARKRHNVTPYCAAVSAIVSSSGRFTYPSSRSAFAWS